MKSPAKSAGLFFAGRITFQQAGQQLHVIHFFWGALNKSWCRYSAISASGNIAKVHYFFNYT